MGSHAQLDCGTLLLPQFQDVAPGELRTTIGISGVLLLGDMPTIEARPIVEIGRGLGLNVVAENASIVSYVPRDLATGQAWQIEDPAEAQATAEAMIAAGVPVQECHVD